MCSQPRPVRTGMEMKMGGKKRFVCEVCKNSICRPLNIVDNPLRK